MTPPTFDAPSLTGLLLPATTADPGLDDLAYSTFTDGAVAVPVSPIDQLLVAFCRRMITDSSLGRVAVIQLPRSRHRIALTLAICMHLLRLRDRLFSGPVVLAALDVDLTTQLRQLSMHNRGRRVPLSRDNPLSAQRLTRAGDVVPLLGGAVADVNSSLIYLNTRVGSPRLASDPPLLVVDATSIFNPESRARVLAWASAHSAVGTIVVGDLGDDLLVQSLTDAQLAPVVLPITKEEVASLVYEFGREPPAPSGLSSMWMLAQDGLPPLSVYRAGDDEINTAIARTFACLASRPEGQMPVELVTPTKLVHSGTRLASTVPDYLTACALANRPGEGPASLRRRLAQLDFNGQGAWRSWGIARWGDLKLSIERLWRHLDQQNPKLDMLWSCLDSADRSGLNRVVLRCHSESAAVATEASLTSETRTDAQVALWERIGERVDFATFSTRFSAAHADVQILTGNPPPWHFSLLTSAEVAGTWMIAYDAERAAVEGQVQRWQDRIDRRRSTTFRSLGARPPARVRGPLAVRDESAAARVAPELTLPGLSILEVLDRAGAAVDAPSTSATPVTWQASGTTRSCVPVGLDDGRTWWVPDEEDSQGGLATPVLVVTAAGEGYLPLRNVNVGDVVIVAAGDGTDSVHARLVAASHTNDEVASLDAILEQFRYAARAVLQDQPTQRAAVEVVRREGAQAAQQLTVWASGRTIAPRDPGDIAAVFRAAGQPTPDLRLLHSVAETLRTLHRALGRFAAALASGRRSDAVEGLRGLIGEDADELLDEFVAATVTGIGEPTQIPSSAAGRLL